MSQDQFHAEVMAELEQQEFQVSEIFPPVPSTEWDFCATLPGYEPGDPIGYGPTKEAAIQDLKEQLDV